MLSKLEPAPAPAPSGLPLPAVLGIGAAAAAGILLVSYKQLFANKAAAVLETSTAAISKVIFAVVQQLAPTSQLACSSACL